MLEISPWGLRNVGMFVPSTMKLSICFTGAMKSNDKNDKALLISLITFIELHISDPVCVC